MNIKGFHLHLVGANTPPNATDEGFYQPDLEAPPGAPQRIGNWMQTAGGRKFWPLDPRPEEIDITDIAAALSKLCRYNGHCAFFYSVAEHSVHVSEALMAAGHDPLTVLTGLLHDATEAYCADVPRPLKPYLSGYNEIEQRVWLAVAHHFGLPPEMPPAVHWADNAVLLAEKPVLMGTHHKWSIPGEPANVRIQGWDPDLARYAFMRQFTKLTSFDHT